MTIDGDKAHAIMDALERTGRNLRDLQLSLCAVEHESARAHHAGSRRQAAAYQFPVGAGHLPGADYFRRWHREKDMSGGLLVHKATHHFDLVNWWIASQPETVFAMGDLHFYGKESATARGESYAYERYTGVPEAEDDPFALRLDQNETLRSLYLSAEAETGYLRDRNVFGEPVTIEDTMSVTAPSQRGASHLFADLLQPVGRVSHRHHRR